jgi:hypothetical protein
MVTVEVFTSERVLMISLCGGPCENRTHDQRIKSPLLYQTELTARLDKKLFLPSLRILVKRFFTLLIGLVRTHSRRGKATHPHVSERVQSRVKRFFLMRSRSSAFGG